MGLSKVSTRDVVGITGVFDVDNDNVADLTIAPEAMAHIINMLTEIYTNPVDGAVRETISNAMDATQVSAAAGLSPLPLEISSPSDLYPYFSVRDHGSGMSLETVDKVYMSYGRSTKRDDFTQIGAHGLGAKAPLAYTDQYEVTTTHEGVTTHFVVFRDEVGPRRKIVSSGFTGETSGTFVKIPARVSDFYLFANALDTYREYSFDEPVVINNVSYNGDPSYVFGGEITIEAESGTTGRVWVKSDGIQSMIENAETGKAPYIGYVLNGYMYPAAGLYWARGVNERVIVELKPGVVNFPSARDSITDNDRSARLNDLVRDALGPGSKILYNALVKSVSTLSGSETLTLLSASEHTLPHKDEAGIRFKNYPGYWQVSDFLSSDGSNVIEDSIAAKCVVYGAASVAGNSINTPFSFERCTGALFPLSKTEVSQTTTEFTKAVVGMLKGGFSHVHDDSPCDECPPLSSVPVSRLSVVDVVSALSMDNVHTYFMSVSSGKDIRLILRQRKALIRAANRRLNLVFVDAARGLSDTDKAFIDRHFEGHVIEHLTVDDVLSKADPGREAAAAEASAAANIIVGEVFSYDGIEDRSRILNGYFRFSPRSLNIEGYIASNAVFVPVLNSTAVAIETVKVALNGYLSVHGEDSLAYRPVIVIVRPKKANFDAIGDYSRIIVPENYISTSKAVTANLAPHTYGRPLVDDILDEVNTDELIAYYVESSVSSWCVRVASEIAGKFLEKGMVIPRLDRAMDFMRTYSIDGNLYPTHKTEVTKNISAATMKERLGDEKFSELHDFMTMCVTLRSVNAPISALHNALSILKDDNVPAAMSKATFEYVSEAINAVPRISIK